MVRLLTDFTRVCEITDNGEELCSCDFRINIYGCPHNGFYVFVAKILIPICLLATMMAGGNLIYLIKIKKIPFFLPAGNDRGLLRPRPMHSYHLIVLAYMSFAAFHMVALVNEWYPNITVAEFFNIMINVATSCAAVFYTVSIVYSTPNIKYNENFELLNKNNGPNTRVVDIVGIVLFLLPIVMWIPLAILTGHYAEANNIKAANILYTIHYLSIVVWELGYTVAIAYFWHKLMTVIKSYVKLLKERNLSSGVNEDKHVEKIKKCTRNITLPVMAIIGGLLFQAAVYAVMSLTHRTITIYYFGWNVFYFWSGYVAFPLLGLSVESFLIYYSITNSNKSANSGNSSKTSSQTQVNSGTTINYAGNDETGNAKNLINNTILCCKPDRNFRDDTADTSSNPPLSPIIIHYTSEVNTVVE